MRVQRAPRAAAQPQPRLSETPRSPARAPETSAPFIAEVVLDVTDLQRDADDEQVVAEVLVRLLAACRAERLVDDDTTLQVLTPLEDGWSGVTYDQAARLSAHGIAAGLGGATPGPPRGGPQTLTVVRLTGPPVRTAGDWGIAGLATATLGPRTSTVVSWSDAAAGHLQIVSRGTAALTLSLPACPERSRTAVRVLQATALALEGRRD